MPKEAKAKQENSGPKKISVRFWLDEKTKRKLDVKVAETGSRIAQYVKELVEQHVAEKNGVSLLGKDE